MADRHHLPQRGIRGHRAQHLLRPGDRRDHRHDGEHRLEITMKVLEQKTAFYALLNQLN